MEATVFIIVGVMALVLATIHNHFAKKKRILHFLTERYGQKPEERKYDLDEIKILWKELDEKKEGIDEITWNDLDMDDVFRRINACNSSLGEQVLYRCIRRSPFDYHPSEEMDNFKETSEGRRQDGGNLEFLEKQVSFFAGNSQVRQRIQTELFGFGKRKGNYYVPMFLNNLDSFRYLIGAFLLDFIFFNRMIRLMEKNRECIWEMFFAVGRIDMAVAIASYRESLPVWCIPEISRGSGIDYREVYNPLLSHPVCNDFRLETNCMITGSNASGKSTFMKSVAVNEILAFSIHTCSAKHAVIPKMEVYTSMAVRDDLLAGESYFVKEIKSLRRIVRKLEETGKALVVIDEILRGTNSRERIAASAAILKYLEERNCMVIVASHDMELAKMLQIHAYRNYYFCEKETKGRIEFDYKIHEGICMQTNAIKLLEHFEFPQDMIKDAYAVLCGYQ